MLLRGIVYKPSSICYYVFFFSSRRRHTRYWRDWSSDVCSSDLKLLFRTDFFRRTINSMISGASGRKRVQPSQIESLQVPLPPLPVQEAIVSKWVQAQETIKAAYGRVEQHKEDIEARFFNDLGLELPEIKERPKVFAVLWNDFRRWSLSYNQAAQSGEIGRAH